MTYVGSKYKCIIHFRSIFCCSLLHFLFNKNIQIKMQSMLSKCKHEQYEPTEQIKKLGNTFLNAQLMSIQQAMHISLSNENNIFKFNFRNHIKRHA
jgi:hypothetical protein